MKFDPQKYHRRSIRLQGYDYSQAGAYFVTIVAWQRECLFGEVVNGERRLNRHGEIIQKWWSEIPNHFSNVDTGASVIMPNHVHGVIIINNGCRGTVPVPNNEPNLDGNSPIQNDTGIIRRDESVIHGGEIRKWGEMTSPLRVPSLGQIIAYFKYQSTKEKNTLDSTGGITKFGQRNYYEHIIRNDREMDNIWRYIESNPSAWAEDDENPSRTLW